MRLAHLVSVSGLLVRADMAAYCVYLNLRRLPAKRWCYESMPAVVRSSSALHTSAPRQAVWFMAPLARIAVAVGARLSRMWWRRLSKERKEGIKKVFGRRRYVLYGAAGLLGVSGAGFYYKHVEETPLTRRKRFIMYSREEVRRLIERELRDGEEDGHGVAELILPGVPSLPSDHPQFKLVHSIAENIITSNQWCDQMKEPAWKVSVVDAPVANAVSLPTGDIIVFTGMLQACKNHHELGLIISHEMAHVLLGHGVETLSHNGLMDFLGLFFIAAIWLFIPSDLFSFFTHKLFRGSAALLLHNPYSRKLELEADRVGFALASAACYDPAQAIQVWTHLSMYNESDRVQEYLDTHPCNQRRHEMLTSFLPHAMTVFQTSQCEKNLGEELKKFRQISKRTE